MLDTSIVAHSLTWSILILHVSVRLQPIEALPEYQPFCRSYVTLDLESICIVFRPQLTYSSFILPQYTFSCVRTDYMNRLVSTHFTFNGSRRCWQTWGSKFATFGKLINSILWVAMRWADLGTVIHLSNYLCQSYFPCLGRPRQPSSFLTIDVPTSWIRRAVANWKTICKVVAKPCWVTATILRLHLRRQGDVSAAALY